MLFPTESDVSDLQLRLGVRDSFDKPQAARSAVRREAAERRPPETLLLSRTKLQEVSESLLRNHALKYLYLEGNELCSVPPTLFMSLPNLLWLDLRHNQIQALPPEIGHHRCLRSLLLEGNPITELPAELGNVLSLTGLNLRDCPLHFPPQGVVQRGVQSVLQYLRASLAQRPVSAPKSLPDAPVVERLQLELMGSSLEEEDDEEEEEELLRFRELKVQMSLMEKNELETAASGDKPKAQTLPKRKKVTAGVTPQLQLEAPLWNRPEERRQAALKELQEKEAILEQRRKSQEALRKWWTQPKKPQQKKKKKNKKKAGQKEVVKETETDTRPAADDSGDSTQRQPCSAAECEESSAVRRLRQQIYAVVQKMEERRRNPTGCREEQIDAAGRDVKEMRRLQAQLLDVKRRRRFTLTPEENGQGHTDK